MNTSPREVFLKDIQETTENYTKQKDFFESYLPEERERLSVYVEVEKHLSHSASDEQLRTCINRRLKKWQAMLLENEAKLKEANEALELLAVIKNEAEKRKDDLSI